MLMRALLTWLLSWMHFLTRMDDRYNIQETYIKSLRKENNPESTIIAFLPCLFRKEIKCKSSVGKLRVGLSS